MNYKPGDLVKIKSWRDMADEFGVDHYGDIMCNGYFVSGMYQFCEKIVEIETAVINARRGDTDYTVVGDDDEWKFTDDMIERPATEEETEEYGHELGYRLTPRGAFVGMMLSKGIIRNVDDANEAYDEFVNLLGKICYGILETM